MDTKHTPTPWEADGTRIFTEAMPLGMNGIGRFLVAEIHGETTEEREYTAAFIVRACNSHAALVANVADSAWLLRELLSRCKDQEWRGRIEAQIGASDTVLALAGAA